MLLRLMLFLCLSTSSAFAITKAEMIAQIAGMTDAQIWSSLTTRDANGWSGFGKCWIFVAKPTACPGCFCTYYFKGGYTVAPWGLDGFPIGGTGCMHNPPVDPICWGGWPANYCTPNVQTNARNQLIDAINFVNALTNDVCDLAGYTNYLAASNPPSLKVTDSSKLVFVRPTEPCASGKYLCGTTELATPINGQKRFVKITDGDFCAQAHAAIEKKLSTMRTKSASFNIDSKYITCAQYNSMHISSQELLQAQTVQQNLNHQWYGNLASILPYPNYSTTQRAAMSHAEIALFSAVVGELLPNDLKIKLPLIDSAKKGRAPAAVTKLSQPPSSNGTVSSNYCTLHGAVNYIESGDTSGCP